MAKTRKPDTNTTTDDIVRRLREDIFNGVLVPGNRLTIASLSDRYAVSHLPVREALRVIEGERLVRILPHRGAVVRSIDAHTIANIFDCRSALDVMIAAKCAERITPAQVARLETLAEQHKAALAAKDSRAAFAANRGFHALTYTVAGNEDALRMVQSGWELVYSLRRQYGISDRRQADAIREHGELVRAYRDSNRSLVLALTAVHCELAKNDLLEQFRLAEHRVRTPRAVPVEAIARLPQVSARKE